MSLDHHNPPTSTPVGDARRVLQVDYHVVRAVLHALSVVPEREAVVDLRARPADVVFVEGERTRFNTLLPIPELTPVISLALPARHCIHNAHWSCLWTPVHALFRNGVPI